MLRAAPATTRKPASSEVAFRSFILSLTISKNLFARHLSDLVLVRLFGTSRDAGSFLEQNRSRRRFGNERERLVLIHRDHDRNNHAGLIFRLGIKLLAEGHDVDTVLAEGGANGRGGGGPLRPGSAT